MTSVLHLQEKTGEKKVILYFSRILKYVKKLNWTNPSKNVDVHMQDLH